MKQENAGQFNCFDYKDKSLKSITLPTSMLGQTNYNFNDERRISVVKYSDLLSVHRDESGLVTAVKNVPYATIPSGELLDLADPVYKIIEGNTELTLGKPVARHLVTNGGLSAVIFETNDATGQGSELVGQKLKALTGGYTVFPSPELSYKKVSGVPEGQVIALLREMTLGEVKELLERTAKSESNFSSGDYVQRPGFHGVVGSDGTHLFGSRRSFPKKK